MPKNKRHEHPDYALLESLYRGSVPLRNLITSEKFPVKCLNCEALRVDKLDTWFKGSRLCKKCAGKKRQKVPNTEKQCTKCKLILPLENFHCSTSQASGYAPACKACSQATKAESRRKNPERAKEVFKAAKKRYAERHPERLKRRARERNFRKRGLTLTQYENLVQEQQGRCYICEEVPPKLVADHNHTTGQFRALLCRGCNVAIGHIYEKPEIAERIALYLRKKNPRCAI